MPQLSHSFNGRPDNSHGSQVNYLLAMAEEHVCQEPMQIEKMSSSIKCLENNILKDKFSIPLEITTFLSLTTEPKGHSHVASVPGCRPPPQGLQEGHVDFAKNGISLVVMPQTPS